MNELLKTIFIACAKHDGADQASIYFGLLQLQEAINVGELRGDELRSIREISPTFDNLHDRAVSELLK